MARGLFRQPPQPTLGSQGRLFAPLQPAQGTLYQLQLSGGIGGTYQQVVLADSPLAYWRFGESAGTVADDISAGGGANADYTNGPTLGVAGLLGGDTDTAVAFSRAADQYAYASGVMP